MAWRIVSTIPAPSNANKDTYKTTRYALSTDDMMKVVSRESVEAVKIALTWIEPDEYYKKVKNAK